MASKSKENEEDRGIFPLWRVLKMKIIAAMMKALLHQ